MNARHDEQNAGGGEGAGALTAARIATIVGGSLVGDGQVEISGVNSLDRARGHEVSFCTLPKFGAMLEATKAGVVLLSPQMADAPAADARARVVVEKPQEALLMLLPLLYPPSPPEPGVHASATIGRGAVLGDAVQVGPNVVIGAGATIGARTRLDANVVIGERVTVGEDCILFPGVVVYPACVLGDRVRLHAGVRIGADGFGYVFRNGQHQKVPQVGRAIIESDVEVGANSTIDRGSVGDTVIGAGSKLDNLVHIAHNVRMGRLCIIVAQVGISGSVTLGDGVIVGGQAAVVGHVKLGENCRVAGQSGVFGDVPAGETWSGYPARPHRESLRAQAALWKLTPLVRRITELLERDGNGR
ncbi:MAG: UDP-3-O-[3-hydroxymyristoyl] glucosamine N-acyltransferase [Gemmatimonadetes bacterium]|nr:UDP-3-O-[3-hydroxymyristoyl] glucosamine N-acyltransferase [Gemmatimonadota bacterium]